MKGVVAILHQQKMKQPKRTVDLTDHGIDPTTNTLLHLPVGDDRSDNNWLQFRYDSAAQCQHDLETSVYIDKTHWGYQTWPVDLKSYVSHDKMLKIDRDRDELNPTELIIFNSFSNTDFLEKFFKYLSLEIKKGRDSFSSVHFALFKGLFRNFGIVLLPKFEAIVKDLLEESIESKHRCAAEVLSGMIRGSRNWNYENLSQLWNFMCPLLRKTFHANIIPEMLRDWAIALLTATVSTFLLLFICQCNSHSRSLMIITTDMSMNV